MRHGLIVANRTLGAQHLRDRVRALATAGPWTFHVLVPVHGHDADDAVAAERRLQAQLAALRELVTEATGELVPSDPYTATMDVVRRGGVDEIVVCTLPTGLSGWLGTQLIDRLERSTDVPVTHVIAPAGLPDRVTARAVRLTIYVGEGDHHGRTPLSTEIVQRARAAGLAGATVVRGVEGFGASSVIHTSRLLTMSQDLPLVIVIIDSPERIDAFLPQLDDLVHEGLVVRDPVDIIKYDGRR